MSRAAMAYHRDWHRRPCSGGILPRRCACPGKLLECRLFRNEFSVITQNPMSALERRAVGSLALLYSFRMLGLFMVLPLLALYAAELPGASPFYIGMALGGYGLSQALLQIPLGWLSDRVGRKPVIIGGLLVFLTGSLVAGAATTMEGLVFGRILQGAGAIAAAVMALVADLTAEEQRTKAMAVVGASIGLSFGLAIVIGPLVAAIGGLSAVFYLTAALAAMGILIVLIGVPTPQVPPRLRTDVGAQRGLVGAALQSPELRRLYLGIFTLHFILTASFLLVPQVLEQVLGVVRANHSQVYLPVLVLSLLGIVPLMRLAEYHGRIALVLPASVLLLLVAMAGLSLVTSAPVYYTSLWLFFVMINYLEATLPSLVSKSVFAGGRGTAMGIFSTSQFLGIFAGGAVGGWVLQSAGGTGLLLLCLVPGILWLLAVLPGKHPLPVHSEGEIGS